METYRDVWNNFFNYLKEHWKIKDFEKIESYHVQAYMEYKIEYYPSKQYLEKISAAIGKLEIALTNFSKNIHNQNKEYDFSIRQTILDESRDLKLVANNYHNRAYKNPKLIISNLQDSFHKIAAQIQLQGGARIEGVALIKKQQMLGKKVDDITNQEKGILWTKEKGGKEGEVLISSKTYDELVAYFTENETFKINRQAYYNDLKNAILLSKEITEGSHGFRWNFAQRRIFELGKAGYLYNDSLLILSAEMKHNRAEISAYYQGWFKYVISVRFLKLDVIRFTFTLLYNIISINIIKKKV